MTHVENCDHAIQHQLTDAEKSHAIENSNAQKVQLNMFCVGQGLFSKLDPKQQILTAQHNMHVFYCVDYQLQIYLF